MSLSNETNLKSLLKNIPHNVIVTSNWLVKQGISRQLSSKYTCNGWLQKLANGAYLKIGDNTDINGAIYALQAQLNLSIHTGGITALNENYNILHNIPFERKTQLFGFRGEKLPKWFNTLYGNDTELNLTSFLPAKLSLTEYNCGDYKIKISSPERAVFEMLYLVPEKITLNEAYQIFEMLISVRPDEFNILAQQCNSVKIKRLFLYMAETANHSWFKQIDLSGINLGKGVREITKGGKYNKKYNIIIGDIREI